MSKTNAENFEERRDELPDLTSVCEQISDAISCAEGCETPADFDANLDDAIAAAEALIKAIRELREGK